MIGGPSAGTTISPNDCRYSMCCWMSASVSRSTDWMRSMVFRSSFAGPVALTLVRTRMAVSRVILIHGDALLGRPPHQSTRRYRLPARLGLARLIVQYGHADGGRPPPAPRRWGLPGGFGLGEPRRLAAGQARDRALCELNWRRTYPVPLFR